MIDQLSAIKNRAQENINKVSSEKDLEQLRVDFLGKKGELTQVLKSLGILDEEMRRKVGQIANEIKEFLQQEIQEKKQYFQNQFQQKKLREETIDITLPGRKPPRGHVHPITQIISEITHIFKRMGFQLAEGPELEDEYYNFDALNLPPHHPARDDHDSFYITSKKLLRTQTSPVQIRVMEKQKPPLAIISPGRCFRRDAQDATHSHTFHQIEGLSVDRNISFADLKGVLHLFGKQMFGSKTKVRFRPDFFPFTEPSAEFAVSCFICGGKGCRVCKKTGWIEIGGCGLVDPAVFGFVNIDPEIYSGYAFGMGIERLAMVRYGIPDIRLFYENDLRFLKQF